MNFDDVRAQPLAVRVLKTALGKDRLASAYLFDGPSGVGKERAAIALASARLCPQRPNVGCGKCETCKRIEARQHPDVRVFAPRDEGDRNLQVEFVRTEILPFTQFAPFEANAAFIIFREADVCFPVHHAEAANAMLKTLEEPRPNVHFVLLSERPDRLLQTIRSRCQRVRMQRLPAPALQHVLTERGIAADKHARAIALADGRADRAIALAEGAADELGNLVKRIDQVIEQRRMGLNITLAEELAKREDLPFVFETLALYYRDIAAASLGPAESALLSARELQERAGTLSAASASARVEKIIRAREQLERSSLNTELMLDALFPDLARA